MYSDPWYVWVRWSLWGPSTVLLGALIAHMWRRGLHREYPAFTLCASWCVVRFFIAFFLHTSGYYMAYFNFHFYADALEATVLVFVAAELYRKLFQNLEGLRALGRLLFRWTTVIMLLIAAMAAAAKSNNDLDRVWALLTQVDIGCKLLVGGIIFFLFLFSSYFGVPWRRYSIAIAVGVALYMTVGVLDRSAVAIFGKLANHTVTVVDDSAYLCMTLIWFVYLRLPERIVTPPSRSPAHNLDKWNATLQELLAR